MLEGALQLQEGKLDLAKASLERALSLMGPRAETHFFLGRIAAVQQDDSKAESEFDDALDADASFVPARFALSEVLMRKARWEDARSHLTKTVDAQPTHFEARRLLAGAEAALGRFPSAEKLLLALAAEQPGNVQVQHQLGTLYTRMGSAAKAEPYLQKAFELDPQSTEAVRALTEFYLQQRQGSKAIQTINARVPDARKSGIHYELIAQANFNMERFQEAETALRAALQREPNRSSAYTALGQVYLKAGNLDKIPAQMDELLKVDPRASFAHVLSAFALQLQGKTPDALKRYKTALEIDPNNVFAANNLAYILAQRNEDLETAVKWAQVARKLDPENGAVADTLGWVYYKQGHYGLAREQFRFAVNKLPNSEEIWYHLGISHLKVYEFKEAEAALKRALASNRNFPERAQADSALAEVLRMSR
jgi:tetratricopeptide (TPR) repeat protein